MTGIRLMLLRFLSRSFAPFVSVIMAKMQKRHTYAIWIVLTSGMMMNSNATGLSGCEPGFLQMLMLSWITKGLLHCRKPSVIAEEEGLLPARNGQAHKAARDPSCSDAYAFLNNKRPPAMQKAFCYRGGRGITPCPQRAGAQGCSWSLLFRCLCFPE